MNAAVLISICPKSNEKRPTLNTKHVDAGYTLKTFRSSLPEMKSPSTDIPSNLRTSFNRDLIVTIDAKDTIRAVPERTTQEIARMRLDGVEFLMSPSLFHAYWVENTAIEARATTSSALAAAAKLTKETLAADREAAPRMSNTVSAAVVDLRRSSAY